MERILEDAADENHADADCILVAVLSHGELGILYSYDQPYKPDCLWGHFTGDKCPTLAGKPKLFFVQVICYPRWYLCTARVYVLLSCCSCSCGHITQNTALLSNFTMLSAYYTNACTLAMQPCPSALPGSLAQQPCSAALPGSLAWRLCPAALPGSLVRQP
jgi:hypothetical protein